MSHIRLTIVSPQPERLADVRHRYAQIVAYVATLPGYISGWVVEPTSSGMQVGRLTIWQTAAAANFAATNTHAMALHSQAQFASGGTIWDGSFNTSTEEEFATTAAEPMDVAAIVQAAVAWSTRRL